MTKVTVGIPYYRNRQSLVRLLAALDHQVTSHLKREDVEVIVVNDGAKETILKEDIVFRSFHLSIKRK